MLTAVQKQIKGVFSHVDSVVNLYDAMAQPISHPSIGFVLPVNERPAGNSRDIGPSLQHVHATFAVVIGIKSTNDAAEMKELAMLEQHRQALRKALNNWIPKEGYEPIVLAASDMLSITPSGLWWIDRFTTNTFYMG